MACAFHSWEHIREQRHRLVLRNINIVIVIVNVILIVVAVVVEVVVPVLVV